MRDFRAQISAVTEKKSLTLKCCHLKLPDRLVFYSWFKKYKHHNAKINETKPNPAIIESTDRGTETTN